MSSKVAGTLRSTLPERGSCRMNGLNVAGRPVAVLEDIYFIPEETPLYTQLLNFREKKVRGCLIVDEYGEILGLLTVEDIVEEIVGDVGQLQAAFGGGQGANRG